MNCADKIDEQHPNPRHWPLVRLAKLKTQSRLLSCCHGPNTVYDCNAEQLDIGRHNSICKVLASAITFAVTVSSIGTNVQVRFEGILTILISCLDDEAQDTTISADGTTGYSLVHSCQYVTLGKHHWWSTYRCSSGWSLWAWREITHKHQHWIEQQVAPEHLRWRCCDSCAQEFDYAGSDQLITQSADTLTGNVR